MKKNVVCPLFPHFDLGASAFYAAVGKHIFVLHLLLSMFFGLAAEEGRAQGIREEKGEFTGEQIKQDLKLPDLPIEKMRGVVYTKAFAQRFKLPELPDMPKNRLPEGVHAIELVVDMKKATYGCSLKVYLDDAIPIYYPKSLESVVMPKHEEYFFSNTMLRWSEQDRKRYSEYWGLLARMGGYITNAGYKFFESGFQASNFLQSFRRNLVPGISYLHVGILGCGTLRQATMVPDPQLWFFPADKGDPNTPIESSEFIKLDLPEGLFDPIKPWLKQLDENNSTIWDEYNRRRLKWRRDNDCLALLKRGEARCQDTPFSLR